MSGSAETRPERVKSVIAQFSVIWVWSRICDELHNPIRCSLDRQKSPCSSLQLKYIIRLVFSFQRESRTWGNEALVRLVLLSLCSEEVQLSWLILCGSKLLCTCACACRCVGGTRLSLMSNTKTVIGVSCCKGFAQTHTGRGCGGGSPLELIHAAVIDGVCALVIIMLSAPGRGSFSRPRNLQSEWALYQKISFHDAPVLRRYLTPTR